MGFNSGFKGLTVNRLRCRGHSALLWPCERTTTGTWLSFVSLPKWIKIRASVIKDVLIQCLIPFILHRSGRTASMHRYEFQYVFRTVHLRIILVGNYDMFIWILPLHVSSNYVLILRRTVVLIQHLNDPVLVTVQYAGQDFPSWHAYRTATNS